MELLFCAGVTVTTGISLLTVIRVTPLIIQLHVRTRGGPEGGREGGREGGGREKERREIDYANEVIQLFLSYH